MGYNHCCEHCGKVITFNKGRAFISVDGSIEDEGLFGQKAQIKKSNVSHGQKSRMFRHRYIGR